MTNMRESNGENQFQMPIWMLQTLHWPSNFDTIDVHGKMHPKNPPSVWLGVPKSQIPIPSVVQKDIKKTPVLLKIKLMIKWMLFLELDKINYTNLKESLINNKKRLCVHL